MSHYIKSEIYAAKNGGSGEEVHDLQNVLAELVEWDGVNVEIGYTDPKNIRRYIKFDLAELVRLTLAAKEAT